MKSSIVLRSLLTMEVFKLWLLMSCILETGRGIERRLTQGLHMAQGIEKGLTRGLHMAQGAGAEAQLGVGVRLLTVTRSNLAENCLDFRTYWETS